MESFADSFNASVIDFLEEVEEYEEALAEVQEINELAGQVVDLVRIIIMCNTETLVYRIMYAFRNSVFYNIKALTAFN